MSDPSNIGYDPTDTLDTGDDFQPLGFFTGTIRRGFWSTPMAESEGKHTDDWATKTRLYWYLDDLDIHQEDFDGAPESLTHAISVGKAWEFDESGRLAIHPDQAPIEDVLARRAKMKVFSPSTMYGMILDLATGKRDGLVGGNVKEVRVLDGGPELSFDLVSIGNYFRQTGRTDARDATIWEGLRITFRGVGIVYGNTEDPDNVRMTAVPSIVAGFPDQPFVRADQGQPSGAAVNQVPAQVVQGPNVPPVTTAATPSNVTQLPTPAPAAEPYPIAQPEQPQPQVAPAPTAVPGSAPTSPQDATVNAAVAAGLDAQAAEVLRKLAGASASAGEFTRNAMMLPAVSGNAQVAAVVGGASGW